MPTLLGGNSQMLFCGVYIPPGLTEMKLREFLALNQDTMTWLTLMLRKSLVSRGV
jgi:hypothetical protein